jgi:hypothetical protein
MLVQVMDQAPPITQAQALRALRLRGIDPAEPMLEFATAAEILSACRRWDKRKGVGAGLLVKWIRDRDFPAEEPPAREYLRARFDAYAQQFPEGSIAESHGRLQERRWPEDERCMGEMIVIETTYPIIAARCSECDFEAAYPVRSLHILDRSLP